jgi:hypothetical protein
VPPIAKPVRGPPPLTAPTAQPSSRRARNAWPGQCRPPACLGTFHPGLVLASAQCSLTPTAGCRRLTHSELDRSPPLVTWLCRSSQQPACRPDPGPAAAHSGEKDRKTTILTQVGGFSNAARFERPPPPPAAGGAARRCLPCLAGTHAAALAAGSLRSLALTVSAGAAAGVQAHTTTMMTTIHSPAMTIARARGGGVAGGAAGGVAGGRATDPHPAWLPCAPRRPPARCASHPSLPRSCGRPGSAAAGRWRGHDWAQPGRAGLRLFDPLTN